MARKPRVDSVSEAVRVMTAATQELQPPTHVALNKTDMPFWRSVIAEFARADWSAHQLELAAMLARMMADLSREQRRLRREGFILKRANGTTVENPRSRIVKGLVGDILSQRRSLALHARARSGDSRNDGTRREQGRSLEVDLGDDLLARPSLN